MVRGAGRATAVVCAAATFAALAPSLAVAGSSVRPAIKGAEVGYFGGATVTHTFSVFVYSNMGPGAGNRVTVCVEGVCKRARGHNASLAWYSASFSSSGLRMGQTVRYTATAADAAGQTSRRFASGLLCMHNKGSTPQS
jgi:hypothetical protein